MQCIVLRDVAYGATGSGWGWYLRGGYEYSVRSNGIRAPANGRYALFDEPQLVAWYRHTRTCTRHVTNKKNNNVHGERKCTAPPPWYKLH
eukprot:3059781-Rhodomonas_salina.1